MAFARVIHLATFEYLFILCFLLVSKFPFNFLFRNETKVRQRRRSFGSGVSKERIWRWTPVPFPRQSVRRRRRRSVPVQVPLQLNASGTNLCDVSAPFGNDLKTFEKKDSIICELVQVFREL